MGNYTIFGGFENLRRGREAKKLTTNVQIVLRTDIFQKLTLGAPGLCHLVIEKYLFHVFIRLTIHRHISIIAYKQYRYHCV